MPHMCEGRPTSAPGLASICAGADKVARIAGPGPHLCRDWPGANLSGAAFSTARCAHWQVMNREKLHFVPAEHSAAAALAAAIAMVLKSDA